MEVAAIKISRYDVSFVLNEKLAPHIISQTGGISLNRKTKALLIIVGIVAGICAFSFLIISLTHGKQGSDTAAKPASSDMTETPVPTGSFSDQRLGFEDASLDAQNGSHNYLNDTSLSCAYNSAGDTVSLGLSNNGPKDYIYLNPTCSAATTSHHIGFYITSSRGPIENSTGPASPNNWNYIIAGQTYDTAQPASYIDDANYGVRWRDSALYDGQTNVGTTLNIRVISIGDGSETVHDGNLLAVLTAEIGYDKATNTYKIQSLKNNDTKYTGSLEADERAKLINDAATFMQQSSIVSSSNQEFWNNAIKGATVEKIAAPYFGYIVDSSVHTIMAGDYKTCDIYAVNLPYPGYGFFTVYAAPQLQLDGLSTATAPGSSDLNLAIIGYDALYPFSESTLYPKFEKQN